MDFRTLMIDHAFKTLKMYEYEICTYMQDQFDRHPELATANGTFIGCSSVAGAQCPSPVLTCCMHKWTKISILLLNCSDSVGAAIRPMWYA